MVARTGFAVPAVWSAAAVATLIGEHPDSVVLLDANRRPTTIRAAGEVAAGIELPVHARAAVVTGPHPGVRAALASAGVDVLDHWPEPARVADGEQAEIMRAVLDVVAGAEVPMLAGAAPEGLAIRPLDDVHPFTALAGFEAPADWWGLAVVTGGNARRIADGTVRDAPSTTLRSVEGGTLRRSGGGDRHTVAFMVTRDNTELSWLEPEAGGPRVDLHGVAIGRVPDALRRALGLATNPPALPTDALFATMWLQGVAGDRCCTWEEASRHHPAVALIAPGLDSWSVENFETACGALGRVCGWDDLARYAASGWWDIPDIDSAHAAWMDPGMVCRALLGSMGNPLESLVAEVRAACPASVTRAVRTVLRRLPVTYR